MTQVSRNNSLDELTGKDLSKSKLPAGAVEDSVKQPSISQNPFFELPFSLTADKPLKNFNTPTIASQQFDGSKDATAFIKSIDPQNASGTIPFGLDIAKMVKSNSGAGKSPLSSGLLSLLQDFTKDKSKNVEDAIKKIIEEETK